MFHGDPTSSTLGQEKACNTASTGALIGENAMMLTLSHICME
jgi:hypothetical protein